MSTHDDGYDATIKHMVLYPALSASIPFAQGAVVKDEWFAERTLPVMARSPDKLFFSSSQGGGITNISDQPFFNDMIVGTVSVANYYNSMSGSHDKTSALLSDDSGILESRFAYDWINRCYGQTDTDPLENHPFVDSSYFNAVQYLQNSESQMWPVVNDDPSAIDILDYDGVIEPLTIRSIVGMSSTFVGDNFDPEPHTIKAGLGGNYVLEPYSRFNPITSFYEINDSNRDYPFSYVVDYKIYDGFAQYIPDFTYTNDDNKRSRPFVEQTIEEIAYADISDVELQNYFIYHTSASIDNRPTPKSKTKSRGWTYENSIFGTDSLAFGGLLR
jgi:hypothetical protein